MAQHPNTTSDCAACNRLWNTHWQARQFLSALCPAGSEPDTPLGAELWILFQETKRAYEEHLVAHGCTYVVSQMPLSAYDPPGRQPSWLDWTTICLDLIVIVILYQVAVAADPIAQLKWIGVVLGIGTGASFAIAAAFLMAFALGYWLLLDQRHPSGELRRLPRPVMTAYIASFLTATISIIVSCTLGSRFLQMLLESASNGS